VEPAQLGPIIKEIPVINLFRLDFNPTDFLEAEYTKDILKSRGDELIQMTAVNVEDVHVAERHCRPLCVILSCCYNATHNTKYEVRSFASVKIFKFSFWPLFLHFVQLIQLNLTFK
jgi:hypothetical protein